MDDRAIDPERPQTALSRRSLFAIAGGAALASTASRSAAQVAGGRSGTKLALIGTGGGPVLAGERSMIASAVIVDGVSYLVDCGYGASAGLVKAGLSLRELGPIFITHLHADHLLDLGPLLFFQWLQGRTAPIELHGPPGLRTVVDNLLRANAIPIDYFRQGMGSGPMPTTTVRGIEESGPVMADALVRVTCATVAHPPVVPSFAYRFDTADRSIAFSGDTAPSDELVELARGADVLVHEAGDFALVLRTTMAATAGRDGAQPKGFDPAKFRRHVEGGHSSTEQAARIAAAAGVGTLVLSHVNPNSSRVKPDASWVADARKHFRGEIIVGHDGMII